jgi:hypothetical protein
VPATDNSQCERLALVLEQIALARDTLSGKLEAKDRAQMLRALCGLLDRERILRGEPLPGSLKPWAGKPARRVFSDPLPAPGPAVAGTVFEPPTTTSSDGSEGGNGGS